MRIKKIKKYLKNKFFFISLIIFIIQFSYTLPTFSQSVPDNAYISGNYWYCNSGYKRSGNECIELDVPRSKHEKNIPKNPKTQEYVNNKDSKTILKVASGTGFFVSENGHLVTNQHVVEGYKKVKVHLEGRILETLILARDKINDLALLKVSEKPKYSFSLSSEELYSLQEIIVAGYPFGESISSTLKFTQGIISSVAGLNNNYSQIQIDAALQPGNSGGPIIDDKGNVIGVAVAKLSLEKTFEDYGVIPENTNFGIKSSVVKSLMEGNGVNVTISNKLAISRKDLSRVVSGGTVLLSCWMTVAQIQKFRAKKVLFENLN